MDNQFQAPQGAPKPDPTTKTDTIPVSSSNNSPEASPKKSIMDSAAEIPDSKPNLSTPITPVSIARRKPRLGALFIILIIAALGTSLYVMYTWQHQKVTQLQGQVSSQSSANKNLESQIATLKNSSTTNYTYKISALGIELTVPAAIADLTSAASNDGGSVNLSTQSLTILDPACAASATGTKALGVMSKISGKFTASQNVTLVKQFNSYYIAYTSPTGACSTDTQVNSLAASLVTGLKSTFSSAGTIQ